MNQPAPDKAHHVFGGSTAKFWSNCYGWAALCATLPPEQPGQAAIKGTALHEGVLERKLKAEITKRITGEVLPIVYDDIPAWPPEGSELADAFWEAVWTGPLEEFVTGKQIYVEKKLMLFPDRDAGGTADVIILYYNDKGKLCLYIGDLKTGYYRVEPSEEQLLFYVAAAYLRTLEKGKEIEVFKSFIYQPSHTDPVTHEPLPYTEHEFTKSQVLRAVKRYQKAIDEAHKPKPKFKTGDWCTWCKAKSICTAYNKHVGDQMDLAVRDNALAEVEQLSDEVLKNIFLYGDKIESYISAVRKHIIQRFANGKPLEGIKVISGVARRRWKDEGVAIDTLRGYGLNPTTEKILGITATELMLKNVLQDKDKAAAIMSTLTEKPMPSPKLVPVEDARPAIDIQRVNLLDAFDDDVVDV